MGWVDTLEGSVVGLDTGPLIYYLEENPTYLAQVAPFFEAAARGRFQIVTSLVTLIEVLVRPLRENRQDLVRQYVEIILGSPHLSAFALNEAIAKKAAELRAIYNIRTPDAIQIATAMHAGAPLDLH